VNTPPPRLAFVSGGLPFGGSTTLLCNVCGELVSRHVPNLVLSLERDNPFGDDFARLGVRVVIQDERRQMFENRLHATLKALAEFKPTAVIACLAAVSYEILRYIPPGVTRAGVVQTDHAMFYDGILPYSPFMDVAVGVSEQIRQTLAAKPEFRNVATHFLTSGVNLPATFVARAPSSNSPLRILYFGRLDRPQKRVHLFPEILRVLCNSEIPFTWTIVGEGAESEFLAESMKTARPEQQVRLLGKLLYRDVPNLLAQNDIFLLASVSEGLPLSLLEAMADGLVPVVSDLPSGIRELVDETTGRRVSLDNVEGYAKEMIWLYNNPAEMERLSRNARERVARDFSTAVMAERWLAIFSNANSVDITWPRKWTIKPPLVAPNNWRFSRPGRLLRQLIFRLRNF
jgi:colanic acid/amylovoran biosynthesis glycosyltransferase